MTRMLRVAIARGLSVLNRLALYFVQLSGVNCFKCLNNNQTTTLEWRIFKRRLNSEEVGSKKGRDTAT